MISRGEVGLIVAGIGATSGVLSRDVYTAIIVMVTVTTIITPIWIKKTYQKELNIDLINIFSKQTLYLISLNKKYCILSIPDIKCFCIISIFKVNSKLIIKNNY